MAIVQHGRCDVHGKCNVHGKCDVYGKCHMHGDVNFARLTRFAALILLAAFSATLPAQAGTAVHFTLDRKIDGTAAPFFLAIDKGYFKDERLDVTSMSRAGGPLEVFNRLAAGKADMAVSDLNLLIKFRDAAGTPIKAVFIVFDKPPTPSSRAKAAASPRRATCKARSSARRRPIRHSRSGRSSPRSPASTPPKSPSRMSAVRCCQPMLAAGEIDAITGFSFTSYVDLKANGVPPDDLAVLPMADYGVELYGDAIMAASAFRRSNSPTRCGRSCALM